MTEAPGPVRTAPPWLTKLLLRVILRPEERRQMLGLLPRNLREHRERPGSMAASELRGGREDRLIGRLAAVVPRSETQEFPAFDHLGIDEKAPGQVAQAIATTSWGVAVNRKDGMPRRSGEANR